MKHVDEEIKDKIRNLLGKQVIPVVPAKVVSIHTQTRTCTVEFLDGFQLPYVRLNSSIDDVTEYIVKYPRVDSQVLISPLTTSEDEYFVIGFNEIDSVELVIGDNKCTIDKDKVKVGIYPTQIEITKDLIKLDQNATKIQLSNNSMTIHAQEKFIINNNATSLKTLLNQMVDIFSQIKVLTGSPGSLSPVDPSMTATVAQMKLEIAKLFES